METSPHRGFSRWPNRLDFRRLITGAFVVAWSLSILPEIRADIPWPEVVQRLAYENEKLARRPQGHNGEYFVVCTLYYTPMESGFTFERGFDATPTTRSGLHGHTYPRDFLRSVKKEGFGRTREPVNGHHYIRYNGGDSFAFGSKPSGGGGTLVARFSAAAKPGQSGLRSSRRSMVKSQVRNELSPRNPSSELNARTKVYCTNSSTSFRSPELTAKRASAAACRSTSSVAARSSPPFQRAMSSKSRCASFPPPPASVIRSNG